MERIGVSLEQIGVSLVVPGFYTAKIVNALMFLCVRRQVRSEQTQPDREGKRKRSCFSYYSSGNKFMTYKRNMLLMLRGLRRDHVRYT